MSNKEEKILNYLVICIDEFAKQKVISRSESYSYLKKYKGLEFLNECYEAEHTVSLNDAIEDLTEICKRNGGTIQ
ncbi:MAG: DUF3791 domain-containing protein [Clostridia bacterium]|nr:DUF3791 domain-containing protein [Clostridia bacterium]